MTDRQFDVIVIGGGHNGLVSAAYLARAGQSVLVLERNERVGGTAVTEEIYPGFRVDTVWHSAATFRPRIVRELFLRMQDFTLVSPTPLCFLPLPDGRQLTLWPDVRRSVQAISSLSQQDADRFVDYCLTLEQFGAFVEEALARKAPAPGQLDVGEILRLLSLGRTFRGMGEEMYALLRMLPMSLYEWMDEWFTHPAVRAALGAPGIIGLHQGPRSGGTAFLLLYNYLGSRTGAGLPAPGIVHGGIGRLSEALASVIRHNGGEIRLNAPVDCVRLSEGRTTGVVLVSGEEIAAGAVFSSANPRHTFTELVDPYDLPPSFNRAVENIRFRGVTAKLNLALDGLPRFTAAPEDNIEHLKGRIQIGASLVEIEQAYDAAKYGQFSERPFLDIRIPSLHDPVLAPPGKHTMSILVQYAPYHLRERLWAEAREDLQDTVLNLLEEYAPGFRQLILHAQLLTPEDLESRYGLAEGNLYHGEMALDQLLFMRPVAGWSDYQTPIRGLYFCGAGAHPGGGITGEPGRLAAQRFLEQQVAIR